MQKRNFIFYLWLCGVTTSPQLESLCISLFIVAFSSYGKIFLDTHEAEARVKPAQRICSINLWPWLKFNSSFSVLLLVWFENGNMICLPLFQARCALLSLMSKKMTTTRRQKIRHVTRKTSKDELPSAPVCIFGSSKLPENGQHVGS